MANARCNSSRARLALSSAGFLTTASGFGATSRECGNAASGRRFRRGSKGFTRTLLINTAANTVSKTARAKDVRRKRRQRRPAGSKKTGWGTPTHYSAKRQLSCHCYCTHRKLKRLAGGGSKSKAKGKSRPRNPWTAPVNCWDWPEADCVLS